MFLFPNLPDNKLLFNDTQNTFVVIKIDASNADKDLIEVDDFIRFIKLNHHLLLSLEAIVDYNNKKEVIKFHNDRLKINSKRSPNIKLNRVSKQSPTTLELAIYGFKLGFQIAELLNELMKFGAKSNKFRDFLISYNIPPELFDSVSNGLNDLVKRLGIIDKSITIYYGVGLNPNK
jgi:hypothetical protein